MLSKVIQSEGQIFITDQNETVNWDTLSDHEQHSLLCKLWKERCLDNTPQIKWLFQCISESSDNSAVSRTVELLMNPEFSVNRTVYRGMYEGIKILTYVWKVVRPWMTDSQLRQLRDSPCGTQVAIETGDRDMLRDQLALDSMDQLVKDHQRELWKHTMGNLSQDEQRKAVKQIVIARGLSRCADWIEDYQHYLPAKGSDGLTDHLEILLPWLKIIRHWSLEHELSQKRAIWMEEYVRTFQLTELDLLNDMRSLFRLENLVRKIFHRVCCVYLDKWFYFRYEGGCPGPDWTRHTDDPGLWRLLAVLDDVRPKPDKARPDLDNYTIPPV